jgi:hypothetical protein
MTKKKITLRKICLEVYSAKLTVPQTLWRIEVLSRYDPRETEEKQENPQ